MIRELVNTGIARAPLAAVVMALCVGGAPLVSGCSGVRQGALDGGTAGAGPGLDAGDTLDAPADKAPGVGGMSPPVGGASGNGGLPGTAGAPGPGGGSGTGGAAGMNGGTGGVGVPDGGPPDLASDEPMDMTMPPDDGGTPGPDSAGPDVIACGAVGQACCGATTCTGTGTACVNGTCAACGGDAQPCCSGSSCTGSRLACAAGTCGPCGGTGQLCCGTTCSVSGEVCSNGTCGSCGGSGQPCCASSNCATGYTCSANQCIACGAANQPCCGTTCGSGAQCQSGTCKACGAAGQACCGTTCATGALCSSNMCAACGGANQPCCTGSTCSASGTVCSSGSCKACGGAGQPCCASNTCTASGTTCSSGMCTACGGANQPCCANNTCTASSTTCSGGTCAACGAYGQPCCGSTCGSGLSCSGTTCACPLSTHRCTTPTAMCASDTDSQNCGGPSCFSCVQPNAVAACGTGASAGKCNNTCIGGATYQLCPAGADGKPGCGQWDFESGTVEGWSYDPTNPAVGNNNAAVGNPACVTTTAFSGTHSLAFTFDSSKAASGSGVVYVKVPLCSSGTVDITAKTLSVRFRFVTTSGTLDGQLNRPVYWQGSTAFETLRFFYVDNTTGGDTTPGSWYWLNLPITNIFGSGPISATHLGFTFGNNDWKGTIYVDAFQLF